MKKIVILMKKDISFNIKIYLGIFLATLLLIIAAVLGIDGSEATDTLNYLVYTCCASIIFVPFSYNIEDEFSTRKFISTLPISMNQILTAKLLLGAIVASILSSSALLVFHIFGKTILFRCALIPVMLSIVMASFFVTAFYKWDINIARFVAIAPIILFAFSAKMVEQMNVVGEAFSLSVLLIIFVIVVAIATLMKKITLKIVE